MSLKDRKRSKMAIPRNLLISAVLTLTSALISNKIDVQQWHVDFDTSMGKGTPGYNKKFRDTYYRNELDYFRNLYEKNNLTKAIYSEEIKIPRIIHQIWIGDEDIPETYVRFKESVLKHHPNWKYKLWTNEDVKTLRLYNQEFYDQAEEIVEKANILRYEILNQFGGIYLDIDFECLKSLEPLIHYYDFFTGLQPVDSHYMLNNALIACSPHHPIIWKCIETIKDHMHESTRFYRNGVGHFSRTFTAVAHEVAGVSIAFPTTYFYPLHIKYDSKKSIINCLRPESFAVHYWANTHGTRIPKVGFKES